MRNKQKQSLLQYARVGIQSSFKIEDVWLEALFCIIFLISLALAEIFIIVDWENNAKTSEWYAAFYEVKNPRSVDENIYRISHLLQESIHSQW